MDRRKFIKKAASGACALATARLLGWPREASAQAVGLSARGARPSRWSSPLAGRNLECTLCPARCRIAPGRRGRCRVRENRAGVCHTLVWGTPCLVQIDPIERMPFFHFLPSTQTLSVTTAGCPLECRFCEVWDMALVSPEDVHAYDLPPQAVVDHARAAGVRSISYAYGEPVAFYEYMADTAILARRAGLHNIMHTSAYIEPAPLEALIGTIDAVNVDLKSFDPAFYRDLCGGELAPVLDSLKRIRAAGLHLEITNLLIPGLNDDLAGIERMCRWIVDEIGSDVPLHFARFYPLFKLANLPPTPVASLDAARAVALRVGIEHVYVARVTGHPAGNTICPSCGRVNVERLGFVVVANRIRAGRCFQCGRSIPGRWI